MVQKNLLKKTADEEPVLSPIHGQDITVQDQTPLFRNRAQNSQSSQFKRLIPRDKDTELLPVDRETLAEAQSILTVAENVCRDLGIKWIPSQTVFSSVSFVGDPTRKTHEPWYRDVPSDHPVMQGDTLVIAETMKRRLSPAEWRPLIASTMIYNAKLNTRKTLGNTIILTLVMLAVTLGLLPILLLPSINIDFGQFGLILLGAYLLVTFAGYLIIAQYEKDLYLKADREASEYVGTQTMLDVLEKVQSFKIPEIEGGQTSTLPNISQRVAAMKQYITKTTMAY